MAWGLLIAVFLLGGISCYTTTVAGRAAAGGAVAISESPLRSVLNTINFFALVAALVWGCINLTWYWVLLSFVGVLFANGIIYGGAQGFAFWYSVQPAVSFLCIVGTCLLWFVL